MPIAWTTWAPRHCRQGSRDYHPQRGNQAERMQGPGQGDNDGDRQADYQMEVWGHVSRNASDVLV